MRWAFILAWTRAGINKAEKNPRAGTKHTQTINAMAHPGIPDAAGTVGSAVRGAVVALALTSSLTLDCIRPMKIGVIMV